MSSRFTKNATITFIMNPTLPPQFHVTKMLLKTPDLSSARNETIVRMELPNCRLTIFVNEAFTPLKAISKLRLGTVVRDSGWLSKRDAASHWGKPEQAVKLMSLLHLTSGPEYNSNSNSTQNSKTQTQKKKKNSIYNVFPWSDATLEWLPPLSSHTFTYKRTDTAYQMATKQKQTENK